MNESLIVVAVLAAIVIVLLIKTAVVVPQRSEYIVERLGKYRKSLGAGFHILIPFLDKVAYKRTLKEEVMDIPSQDCITTDNVSVSVDGVLYLQVIDGKLSCYGIDNYRIAASQLAQTSLRSVIGKIELDRTFEERETLNQQVVAAIDEAAQNWGVKVLRYEIKDITLPRASWMQWKSKCGLNGKSVLRLQPLRVTGKLALTGQKDLKERRSRYQKVRNKSVLMKLKDRQKKSNLLRMQRLRVLRKLLNL